jgi:SET domain-containing protein
MVAAGKRTQKWFEVRRSRIHGRGAYAQRAIPSGTRIVEYRGERVSSAEADRRYANDDPESLVLLFVIDGHTLIDAAHGGNEARYINHSCEPNCEAVEDDRRIYIEALRDIDVGEELTYDYNLQMTGRVTPADRRRYACNCGARSCRGTMLGVARRGRRKPRRTRARVHE